MYCKVYDNIWGKDYNIVSFKLPADSKHELVDWCLNSFGPSGYDHVAGKARWINNIRFGEIHFYNDADVNLFLLRWSS
jgi:hypothetical protein